MLSFPALFLNVSWSYGFQVVKNGDKFLPSDSLNGFDQQRTQVVVDFETVLFADRLKFNAIFLRLKRYK